MLAFLLISRFGAWSQSIVLYLGDIAVVFACVRFYLVCGHQHQWGERLLLEAPRILQDVLQ